MREMQSTNNINTQLKKTRIN